jgi:hypothetical protein
MPDEPIIVVSWSEIDSARHCGLKHRLQYRERWVDTKPDTGARALGSDYHLVMQAHMTQLQAIQAELRAAGDAPSGHPWDRWTYPDGTAERLHQAVHTTDVFVGPNAETVAWMYSGFLERWGLTTDWTVLAVEFAPVHPLPDLEGNPSPFHLKTKIDLVVQEIGSSLVWLLDWKTGQRRPNVKTMGLADQFGLYTWILRAMGRNAHGALHSWAKTSRPKTTIDTVEDRFEHYRMDRSQTELDKIAVDAYKTVARAYWLWDHDALGDEPPYPDPEWCQRRCDFVAAHLADRRGFTTLRAYLADTGFVVDPTRH